MPPAAKPAQRRPRRRPRRSVLVRRWLGVGGLLLIGLLYYRPLHTYVATRRTLVDRAAEVRQLRAERRTLERRLGEATTDSALVREARRLGLVKPGERLFIVKGIEEWQRARRTIGRHGR
jgi:cell division protein FtsB